MITRLKSPRVTMINGVRTNFTIGRMMRLISVKTKTSRRKEVSSKLRVKFVIK